MQIWESIDVIKDFFIYCASTLYLIMHMKGVQFCMQRYIKKLIPKVVEPERNLKCALNKWATLTRSFHLCWLIALLAVKSGDENKKFFVWILEYILNVTIHF